MRNRFHKIYLRFFLSLDPASELGAAINGDGSGEPSGAPDSTDIPSATAATEEAAGKKGV